MKILSLSILCLMISCTQKYETFSIIQKETFKYKDEHNPITKKMLPYGKDKQYVCQGQWLFFNNAQTEVENSIENLLYHTCKGKDYLLDATITNTWWTTIIYTRACIEIETSCPYIKK